MDEFPEMPNYLLIDDNNHYIFNTLSLPQLKECWIICEKQKIYCHPNSVFQPLIDRDMRMLVAELKKYKKYGTCRMAAVKR